MSGLEEGLGEGERGKEGKKKRETETEKTERGKLFIVVV